MCLMQAQKWERPNEKSDDVFFTDESTVGQFVLQCAREKKALLASRIHASNIHLKPRVVEEGCHDKDQDTR